jgi:hypothetical protein
MLLVATQFCGFNMEAAFCGLPECDAFFSISLHPYGNLKACVKQTQEIKNTQFGAYFAAEAV